MPEYLDDPRALTKEQLKSELLAHSVELPGGHATKDVYVQLYLEKLTANNKKHAEAMDMFSSDDDLPPPVVFSRSRSSGRKATRKTDKVRPDELDVTALTDDDLKGELHKRGVEAGPVVASTRKLYEKKLQRMLDQPPAAAAPPAAAPPPPKLLLASESQATHNGNSEADLYSDKEDEATPEPEPEPEPVPVVERPVRSRGKTPVTSRTRSSQHRTLPVEDVGLCLLAQDSCLQPAALLDTALLEEPEARTEPLRAARASSLSVTKPSPRPAARSSGPTSPPTRVTTVGPAPFSPVEKIAASEQTPSLEEKDVLKELFPNDINSPTGITATCRRPIRGAAGRPVLWNDENRLFSPKTTKTTISSSYTESSTVNKVSSLPPTTFSSSSSFSSSSRLLSAAPPAGPTKAAYRSVSLWIKLFLLAVVAAFLFLVYQVMETNTINPFTTPDTGVASGSAA
ncbi:Lamina-associated polypeptide 2, isoform beta [Liparis tanakae]|uniref:Lamina-associated polypeptide 2, isoform beta n=1 Tax=Liparis tanakae TaxID=230148 RepID=A0A4Z2FVS8_9TELE|nr:Lamina-associated polypeptide 2, isoform beta [Liparis tanakae]